MGSLRLSHLAKMIWKIIPVVQETVKFFFLNYKTLIKYIPFMGILSSYNCVVF